MLYDKRWDAKVEQKADPFTLEALIAWLEMQPANEPYCYTDHGLCLLGRYFAAHGFKEIKVFSNGECVLDGKQYSYPIEWDFFAVKNPNTFGGALERAREAQQH